MQKLREKGEKETKIRRNSAKSVDNSRKLHYVNYWRMAYLNGLHNCKKNREKMMQ